jgi:hypothetical protein
LDQLLPKNHFFQNIGNQAIYYKHITIVNDNSSIVSK